MGGWALGVVREEIEAVQRAGGGGGMGVWGRRSAARGVRGVAGEDGRFGRCGTSACAMLLPTPHRPIPVQRRRIAHPIICTGMCMHRPARKNYFRRLIIFYNTPPCVLTVYVTFTRIYTVSRPHPPVSRPTYLTLYCTSISCSSRSPAPPWPRACRSSPRPPSSRCSPGTCSCRRGRSCPRWSSAAVSSRPCRAPRDTSFRRA